MYPSNNAIKCPIMIQTSPKSALIDPVNVEPMLVNVGLENNTLNGVLVTDEQDVFEETVIWYSWTITQFET